MRKIAIRAVVYEKIQYIYIYVYITGSRLCSLKKNVKRSVQSRVCFEREIEIGGAFRCAIEISPARIFGEQRRRASNRKDKRRARRERAANRDKSELVVKTWFYINIVSRTPHAVRCRDYFHYGIYARPIAICSALPTVRTRERLRHFMFFS